ncbi:MAG TPA: ester cyclase [Flavisolibacter sp.]
MKTISMTKVDQNKEVALSAVEAVGRYDVHAVFKECTPDFLDYGTGSSKPAPVEAGKQFFKEFVTAFPDYEVSNMKCVADDEWAMVWCDCSGTWKNEFMKQQPTGKGFKFPDVDIFRFDEDGKIIEHHNIVDFSYIFREVGIKM